MCQHAAYGLNLAAYIAEEGPNIQEDEYPSRAAYLFPAGCELSCTTRSGLLEMPTSSSASRWSSKTSGATAHPPRPDVLHLYSIPLMGLSKHQPLHFIDRDWLKGYPDPSQLVRSLRLHTFAVAEQGSDIPILPY